LIVVKKDSNEKGFSQTTIETNKKKEETWSSDKRIEK
jgi:hypothetical protein